MCNISKKLGQMKAQMKLDHQQDLICYAHSPQSSCPQDWNIQYEAKVGEIIALVTTRNVSCSYSYTARLKFSYKNESILLSLTLLY